MTGRSAMTWAMGLGLVGLLGLWTCWDSGGSTVDSMILPDVDGGHCSAPAVWGRLTADGEEEVFIGHEECGTDHALIYVFDSTGQNRRPVATSATGKIKAIWGAGERLWAVTTNKDDSGSILAIERTDAGFQANLEASSPYGFEAIHGTGEGNVWAVGSKGAIWHRTPEGGWKEHEYSLPDGSGEKGDYQFRGVWASPSGEVWVAGARSDPAGAGVPNGPCMALPGSAPLDAGTINWAAILQVPSGAGAGSAQCWIGPAVFLEGIWGYEPKNIWAAGDKHYWKKTEAGWEELTLKPSEADYAFTAVRGVDGKSAPPFMVGNTKNSNALFLIRQDGTYWFKQLDRVGSPTDVWQSPKTGTVWVTRNAVTESNVEDLGIELGTRVTRVIPNMQP